MTWTAFPITSAGLLRPSGSRGMLSEIARSSAKSSSGLDQSVTVPNYECCEFLWVFFRDKPPRRVRRDMLQSRECKTDQGHERGCHRAMNAPLKALESSGARPSGAKGASDLAALMRQIGR